MSEKKPIVSKETIEAIQRELAADEARVDAAIAEKKVDTEARTGLEERDGYREYLPESIAEITSEWHEDSRAARAALQEAIENDNKDAALAALADLRSLERAHDLYIKEQVERTEEHAEMGVTDKLTGLASRAYFEKRLEEQVEHERRHHGPLHVVFIDLDGFKSVNDTFGHHAGDVYLKTIARHMREALRRDDLLARLGGDEFTVTMLDNTREGAEHVAKSLLGAVIAGSNEAKELLREEGIEVGDDVGNVTASIGISEHKEGDTMKSMLDRADTAMYDAKEAGKNVIKFPIPEKDDEDDDGGGENDSRVAVAA